MFYKIYRELWIPHYSDPRLLAGNSFNFLSSSVSESGIMESIYMRTGSCDNKYLCLERLTVSCHWSPRSDGITFLRQGNGFRGVEVMSWIFILLHGKSLLWHKETAAPLPFSHQESQKRVANPDLYTYKSLDLVPKMSNKYERPPESSNFTLCLQIF